MIENLFIILVINTFVISILWLSQLKTRRADLIDVYWGPSFFISVLAVAIKDNSFQSLAILISLALLGVWGFRLGIYLLLRNSKKEEDIRYVKIRNNIGDIGILLQPYLIQIILITVVLFPFQILMLSNPAGEISLISMTGVAIAIFGIVIESFADYQLSNFKGDKANDGKLMDRGLWYYSRHPNYFGDSLFWWGSFLFCFGFSDNIISIISPVLMTFFLLRVSGVTMLERQIAKKKSGYQEYIETTSSFILLPKFKK